MQKTIINGKVLPLLNEYFRGDNKEIKEVFTDTINETKIIVNQNGIEEIILGFLMMVARHGKLRYLASF